MRPFLIGTFIALSAISALPGEDAVPRLSPLSITIAKDVPGVHYPTESVSGVVFERAGFRFPQGTAYPALTEGAKTDELLAKPVEELCKNRVDALLLSNALQRQGRFSEFQKHFNLPALPVKPENLASVEAQIAQRAAKVTSIRPLYVLEDANKSGQWLFYESVMGEKAWLNVDYFAKTETGFRLGEGNLNKDKDAGNLFNALVYDQMKSAHSVEIKPQ